MSVLSAQSIAFLCSAEQRQSHKSVYGHGSSRWSKAIWSVDEPLITPFRERGVVSGKSYGLSACTYDACIDQDLTLAPMPYQYIVDTMAWLVGRHAATVEWAARFMRTGECVPPMWDEPPPAPEGSWKALASTLERFAFPHNIRGHVLDKSSHARVFLSAFNTHFDPGFGGFATIELVNLGDEPVVFMAGDPLCQFLFEWLDEPTELPYVGRKYSNQRRGPQPAILER